MDWFKESQELMQSWTESQKKMWDNWMGSMDVSANQAKASEAWTTALDTWEKTINSGFEAQNQWTDFLTENLNSQDSAIPPEMAEWLKQSEAMGKRWSETQKELWQTWFDLIKKADAEKMLSAWGEDGQKAFTAWQESTQKIMTAQMDWAKQWKPDNSK